MVIARLRAHACKRNETISTSTQTHTNGDFKEENKAQRRFEILSAKVGRSCED